MENVLLIFMSSVPAPPVLTPQSSPIYSTEGTDITLMCDMSGNPLPTISWYKVGHA